MGAYLLLLDILRASLSNPIFAIRELIAKDLFNTATKWCVEQGCTELATDAELANIAAQNFHLNMGFEETYRIVEYKKKIA